MRILPRETKFYDMFAELAVSVTAGANLLQRTLTTFENVEVNVQQLKNLEHAADDTAHSIFTRLNTTYVTPFDREDIHRLAASMDDVLDLAYGAGERLLLYGVSHSTSAAIELASILVRQCEEISHAISALERHHEVLQHCVEINRLENDADRITRGAIATLFAHEKDPIALIKFKEIYEVLEAATDKAEDVADVLEQIVLKSA